MTPAELNALAGPLDEDIAARPVKRAPAMPPLEDDYQANPPELDRDMAHMLGDAVILARGSDLNPVPVAWLWKFWLALKKLHILAGAPGQGKTTIAMAMAATITIGGRWPDGTRCEVGNVVILSGEDDPADTLLPRLKAVGADCSRVYFAKGRRIGSETVPFDPARDMVPLRTAIEGIGNVRLVIIDPVVSAVTGDSHKNTEVRRALQPLVELADACNCAVLGITHFAKGGQGSDPSQRVVGSVAFTAVARIVMVAARVKAEEDGQDMRILARSKSNIGPDDGGFQYHLEQCEPIPGIPASRIAWGKAVDGTARELLTEPDGPPQEEAETSAMDSAADFLRELLTEGSAPSKYVETEAKAAGISWITVRRASDAMGVKKRRMNGAWYWFRPDAVQVAQLAHVAQPAHAEEGEQVARKSNLLTPSAQDAQAQNHEQHEQHEQVAPVRCGEDALEDAQGAQLSKVGILGTFGASSEASAVEATRL